MSATLSLPASAASAASASLAVRARAPLPPLLDEQALLQRATPSEKAAWQALAPAWQLDLGEGDPCQAAQRQQVQCFKGSGGLPLIRQLDRPAILMLNDAQGPVRHVLLTGLRGDLALVQLGADHHAVPMAALSRVWRGDVATFWRAPPGFRSKLLAGQKGPAIDWLAERLARVDGGTGPSPSQTLDTALQARVHAFQLTQGLKPDGVVGATTFMLLNRASGVQEPRLTLEEH
jgi:general secretion pathway protein A